MKNNVLLLMPIIQKSVNWNLARVKFLSQFLIALLKVKTVNFSEIAIAFESKVKSDSSYKRIQRFFRSFSIDYDALALTLLNALPISKFILTLDRTNWKFGKTNINILVLAIAYKKVAFPILWTLLDKRGNSSTEERKRLIDKFLNLVPPSCIQCLTADREFIGKDWFAYLIEKDILFRIRIRENMKTQNNRGAFVKGKDLFRNLSLRETHTFARRKKIDGHLLFVIGVRLSDEFFILVTNRQPETALDDYAKRWEIESLFACLKTRGFNFEKTHLSHLGRIKKLVAILAIAFLWAHSTGEWLHQEVKPIPVKKHGRPLLTLFRYGLNHLQKIVLNLSFHRHDFFQVLKVFADLLSRDSRASAF